MARYHARIETNQSPEEVFAYLSDFSNSQEWDPGVLKAERVGDGPVGEGSQFRLVAEFMGRRTPLTYRIAEYDPPRTVSLVAENGMVTSRDRIAFDPTRGGTRVTYQAHLQLKGALKVIDPLLGLVFERTGDRALEGLRRVLARPGTERLDAAA